MTVAEIEDLRKLSQEIDELYSCGKSDEGEKKLRRALEKAKDIDNAYHFFFQGEMAGYLDNDIDKQNLLFDKAIKLRADDFFGSITGLLIKSQR